LKKTELGRLALGKIAATALTYNHILVTNNSRHFEKIDGLQIEDWAFLPGEIV